MTLNRIAAGAALCCVVIFAAACGDGTAATGSAPSTPTTASSGNGSGNDPGNDPRSGATGGARGFPGATGLLAQIDGKTLQVQGTDTQTAVTYSTKTTFTNTVAARFSDVVVGVCVQARSVRPGSGAGAAPTTSPSTPAGPIVAASVEISPAVNGRCSALRGSRMPGARAPGAAGEPTRPGGTPGSGQTQDPRAGGNRFGGNGFAGLGAFGKVTAVNGAGFTVESSRLENSTASTAEPTIQTVQTPAGTTYTRTRAAKAKALVVGLCVTAVGKADGTGSIAATSITLRPAEKGSCSSGFGGRGPGGGAATTGGNAGV